MASNFRLEVVIFQNFVGKGPRTPPPSSEGLPYISHSSYGPIQLKFSR